VIQPVTKAGYKAGLNQGTADFWSYENVTLVFEIMQKVKILYFFSSRLIKIANFGIENSSKS
jgi:hypothetical protein